MAGYRVGFASGWFVAVAVGEEKKRRAAAKRRKKSCSLDFPPRSTELIVYGRAINSNMIYIADLWYTLFSIYLLECCSLVLFSPSKVAQLGWMKQKPSHQRNPKLLADESSGDPRPTTSPDDKLRRPTLRLVFLSPGLFLRSHSFFLSTVLACIFQVRFATTIYLCVRNTYTLPCQSPHSSEPLTAYPLSAAHRISSHTPPRHRRACSQEHLPRRWPLAMFNSPFKPS